MPESDETKRPSFTMSISLKKDKVEPGERVEIDIELTNVSSKAIQVLQVGVGPPQYAFRVLDQNGRQAPLTVIGEAIVSGRSPYKGKDGAMRIIVGSSIRQNHVAPSRKMLDAFALSDYVDFGQAGRYTIHLERSDPATKLIVKSNAVSLTVAKME